MYSNKEKSLLNEIKSFYNLSIVENTRKLIKPHEIDIYLPDIKMCIEFDGTYWHRKNYRQHINKDEMIRLLDNEHLLVHVQEAEWDDDKEKIVKNLKMIIEKRLRSI